jgi:hypothetical protein
MQWDAHVGSIVSAGVCFDTTFLMFALRRDLAQIKSARGVNSMLDSQIPPLRAEVTGTKRECVVEPIAIISNPISVNELTAVSAVQSDCAVKSTITIRDGKF